MGRISRPLLIPALASLLLLAACMVGPDYSTPETELPDRWHEDLVSGSDARLRDWWQSLGDPMLDSMIERAEAGSFDLREAVARIDESRALLGLSIADRFPDADATGSTERTRTSEEVVPVLPGGHKRTDTFYSLGGIAFWELDLWGRISRQIESADASLEASIEDYRDVQVSLFAEVATTYVEIRALQTRIEYAVGNVRTQRGSLELTQNRRDAGIGSDLEVSQALLNLSTTEAFVPDLRAAFARSVHRLGVLLGEPPATFFAELEAGAPIPEPGGEIALGLPTELLRRRPDVRRAERGLAAQTARIGVATADLYPTFSLFGFLSFEGFDSDEVLDAAARSYSFGPSFQWNLFDGGRVRNSINAEDARTQQSVANYEQTVLRALEDVENSLASYLREGERRAYLATSVEAAQKSSDLVVVLYRTGLTDFQNVLDTQRSLFQQEDALAESVGLRTQNLISLYRALGGGWDTSPAGP